MQFSWRGWLGLIVAARGVIGAILDFDIVAKTTGGVVPMLTLEIGTPPQLSRVQLDSGSDVLVAYAPGEQCESIGGDNFRAPCILAGTDEAVQVGGAMYGPIPKGLLPDGKPLGYDSQLSSTQLTQLEMLFRAGYGSDFTGFITCTLIEDIRKRFPTAIFGPKSFNQSNPLFQANQRLHNLVTGCCEPAFAKKMCNFRPWRDGDTPDNCCASTIPTDMPLGYGGPIVMDEIKGMGMVSFVQSTRIMPKSANIGNCAFPVNGIIGISGTSQLVNSMGWSSIAIDARARHVYLNQVPILQDFGELVELEPAKSGRGLGNQQFWTVMVTDFETSDGKVSFKKFSDAINKFNEENKNKPNFKKVDISMASSALVDTGNSAFEMPPFLFNAFMTAYGADQCKWPKSLELIFTFQKSDGGFFETKIPLSSLLKPDAQEKCKFDHKLRPSGDWLGPFQFIGGAERQAWAMGAPLLTSHLVKYDYKTTLVSFARSVKADEPFQFSFPDVDCPVIPFPMPGPVVPSWVWILLMVLCPWFIPCILIIMCWHKIKAFFRRKRGDQSEPTVQIVRQPTLQRSRHDHV